MQDVGEFDESVEPLREILEQAPGHPEANYRLGLALVQQRQSNSAIWRLERAAESPDFAIPANLTLVSLYLSLKDYDRALAAADRVLALAPDHRGALSYRYKVEPRRQAAGRRPGRPGPPARTQPRRPGDGLRPRRHAGRAGALRGVRGGPSALHGGGGSVRRARSRSARLRRLRAGLPGLRQGRRAGRERDGALPGDLPGRPLRGPADALGVRRRRPVGGGPGPGAQALRGEPRGSLAASAPRQPPPQRGPPRGGGGAARRRRRGVRRDERAAGPGGVLQKRRRAGARAGAGRAGLRDDGRASERPGPLHLRRHPPRCPGDRAGSRRWPQESRIPSTGS